MSKNISLKHLREIQKFVGFLHGKKANKDVLITTGNFAKNAYDYVRTIDLKVILPLYV